MFDMNSIFDDNNTTDEIIVRDAIKVTAKTVTPLLQLDTRGKQRSMYVYENDKTGVVPFFSANGFKGALRRVATKQQVKAIKEKNPAFKIDPELYYLYTSGAALDKTSNLIGKYINYKTEDKVRTNAPIISLFGAGLSNIEGKLAICDLFPSQNMQKGREIEKSDGKTTIVSNLTGYNSFIRSDSAASAKTLFQGIIDTKDIDKWKNRYYGLVMSAKINKAIKKDKDFTIEKVKEHLEKLKSSAKKDNDMTLLEEIEKIKPEEILENLKNMDKRKIDDSKEENSHIQQIVNMDFIIPGVELTSSINAKYGYDISDVEMGCLISSLSELSLMQIGSAKRIGFGVLNWSVEYKGQLLFETKSNPDYVLEKNITVTDAGKQYVAAWKDWLNSNAEKLDLAKISEQIDEKRDALF